MATIDWLASDSQIYDPLNWDKKRTVKNTDKSTYNCAGYALECFSWYSPTDDEWADFGFDDMEEAAKKTEKAVQIMLRDFPTLRVIHTLQEVRQDEYAILFRLASDGDFHYLKRDKGGHWRHKMGDRDKIETMKASDIFDYWYYSRYDGPIVIFAKKRQSIKLAGIKIPGELFALKFRMFDGPALCASGRVFKNLALCTILI